MTAELLQVLQVIVICFYISHIHRMYLTVRKEDMALVPKTTTR